MAVGPPVLVDFRFALATVPTGPDEAGRPPPQVLRATGQPLRPALRGQFSSGLDSLQGATLRLCRARPTPRLARGSRTHPPRASGPRTEPVGSAARRRT